MTPTWLPGKHDALADFSGTMHRCHRDAAMPVRLEKDDLAMLPPEVIEAHRAGRTVLWTNEVFVGLIFSVQLDGFLT